MTRHLLLTLTAAAVVVAFLATYAQTHADLDAVVDGATEYGDPNE